MEDDDLPDEDECLSRWLDEVDLELGKIGCRGALPVPDDFPHDFSPESLPALEAAALEYAAREGYRIDLYIHALGAYLGEAILYTAGGCWGWSGYSGYGDGDPTVIVDPVHKAGPVHVCDIVRRALDERTGEVFAEEHGWMQIAADAAIENDPPWRPVKEEDGIRRPKAG
ncbi:hypothetical protein [Streptomyces sp. NPDC101150]|uniref:hypothetical protein n=1 Tax=Streptomyces sp. NPDC101150 TaxID=3366114 RepID=UPI00382E4407